MHTGEPHRSSAGYSGVAVHRAARICAAGHGGQILLSNTTAGVVEDEMMPGVALLELGEHSLKGLSAPQRLAQLVVDGLESQFGPLRTTDSGPVAAEAGTFLLTDLAGWRRIVLEFGDKTSASLMTDYQERVAVAVAVHHGTILQQAGDEAIAVFTKASDAIAAVDSLRTSLERIPLPPRVEVSLSGVIHSGHWSGTTHAPEAGTALYRLRRLAQVMQPGQVLVSPSTAALLDGDPLHHRLHDLGEVPVQEDGETMAIHELTEPG
jgi:class 3 adenylate cyclase